MDTNCIWSHHRSQLCQIVTGYVGVVVMLAERPWWGLQWLRSFWLIRLCLVEPWDGQTPLVGNRRTSWEAHEQSGRVYIWWVIVITESPCSPCWMSAFCVLDGCITAPLIKFQSLAAFIWESMEWAFHALPVGKMLAIFLLLQQGSNILVVRLHFL